MLLSELVSETCHCINAGCLQDTKELLAAVARLKARGIETEEDILAVRSCCMSPGCRSSLSVHLCALCLLCNVKLSYALASTLLVPNLPAAAFRL